MVKTWSPGDPRPRPDADVPGFAPRPKGQTTPRPLSKSVGVDGLKPKWTPNAGWKTARFQNAGSRASISGARSMAESVGATFRDALRNTSRNSMGPLAGGGGSGGKTGNKTK